MFLSAVARYARMTWALKKISFLAATEYRVNFVVQIFSSLFVELAFAFLWIVFFQKVPKLQGWTLQDMLLVQAIGGCSYELIALLAGGIFELSAMITMGRLDSYLLFPYHVLWHVSVSKTEFSSIGSLFAALILFYYSGPMTLTKIMLFLLMVLISTATFFSFTVIMQSIGFYIDNFADIAHEMGVFLLAVGYYPYVIFTGLIKQIIIYLIPAFFVIFLPANLVVEFDYRYFALLCLYLIGITFIALKLFKHGLKRYESGSLVQIKT